MIRLIAAASFLATPVAADFVDGNQLELICQADDLQLCNGYIYGVVDSFEVVLQNGFSFLDIEPDQTGHSLPHVCFRSGVTIGQIRDVVINYLADAPQQRDFPAAILVHLSLIDAFPCE